MGHTDVSITLNTYTSVFDRYKETELEKVKNKIITFRFFITMKIITKLS